MAILWPKNDLLGIVPQRPGISCKILAGPDHRGGLILSVFCQFQHTIEPRRAAMGGQTEDMSSKSTPAVSQKWYSARINGRVLRMLLLHLTHRRTPVRRSVARLKVWLAVGVQLCRSVSRASC
jgi:hypothetical protein